MLQVQIKYFPAAHGSTPPGAGGYALEKEEPTPQQASGRILGLCRAAHARADFLAGTTACGSLHWICLLLKDCIPWKAAMLEQLLENSSTWEGSTQKEFVKHFITWEGLVTEAKEKREGGRSSRDKMLSTNCSLHS